MSMDEKWKVIGRSGCCEGIREIGWALLIVQTVWTEPIRSADCEQWMGKESEKG